jgi:hypothetical protein
MIDMTSSLGRKEKSLKALEIRLNQPPEPDCGNGAKR